jgi:hypothetical protein
MSVDSNKIDYRSGRYYVTGTSRRVNRTWLFADERTRGELRLKKYFRHGCPEKLSHLADVRVLDPTRRPSAHERAAAELYALMNRAAHNLLRELTRELDPGKTFDASAATAGATFARHEHALKRSIARTIDSCLLWKEPVRLYRLSCLMCRFGGLWKDFGRDSTTGVHCCLWQQRKENYF